LITTYNNNRWQLAEVIKEKSMQNNIQNSNSKIVIKISSVNKMCRNHPASNLLTAFALKIQQKLQKVLPEIYTKY